jgi:BASS family bile acid:Na+ symporter
MIHNVLGLGIGYLVGRLLRLQQPKCVALSIEVGMQNSGLATSLAVLHFAAFPLATIPGAVFSVWHNISGAIAARIYSRTIGQRGTPSGQHRQNDSQSNIRTDAIILTKKT